MAVLFADVLFGFVVNNDNFLMFALFGNFADDFGAVHIGSAGFQAFVAGDGDDFVKNDFAAFFGDEFFDFDSVADGDFVLFAAGFNNCVN